MKEMMDQVGRRGDAPFIEYSDHAAYDDGTTLTSWTWWTIPGTPARGGGLVKVTDAGVVEHWVLFQATPQW